MNGLDRYRVAPGQRFKTADVDADDRAERSKKGKAGDVDDLARLAIELDALQDVLYAQAKHRILLVLQGMDTSGKDGTIRHVFGAVDPLGVRVASFKTPSAEETAHDFLWRVHKEVPRNGEIVIFNRSHYEDVLIVRVHGWIDEDECERRYRHINAFERMLAETGTTMIKCFLHISKDEQKIRLEERLTDKTKNWKFNPGDLRERAVWDDYMKAYSKAISATSTEWAPWYVIPANSKTNRNLLILRLLIARLQSLALKHPEPAAGLDKIKVL